MQKLIKHSIILLKRIVKKSIWFGMGGYQPKRFWDNWGHTFMDDPWQVKLHSQHKWLLTTVKEIKAKSILEVGCGFGRNLKFLLENGYSPTQLTGVDISDTMIKKAKEYVGKRVKLKVANISSLPFKDNSSDVVFTHGVLMHVTPKEVEKSIQECLRVAKKYCIFIEQNYGANEYTFVHNYKSLLEKQNGIIEKYIHLPQKGLDYILFKKR